MRFHTWELLHSYERQHRRGHTIRVVLATIGSIAVLSGLVMILPFG